MPTIYRKTVATWLVAGTSFVYQPKQRTCTVLKNSRSGFTYVCDGEEEPYTITQKEASKCSVYLVVDKFLLRKHESFMATLNGKELLLMNLLMQVKVGSILSQSIHSVICNPTRRGFLHVINDLSEQVRDNTAMMRGILGQPMVSALLAL